MSPTEQLKKLIGRWRKATSSSLSSLWQNGCNLPRWILVAIVLVIVLVIYLLWSWLRGEPDTEPPSTIIRDITLTIGAIVGLRLAYRRVRTLDIQAAVAQESLRNERYQKSADMLDSKTMATRIGGIYALNRLAQDHPEEYHIQVMELLCIFIRYPVEELMDNEEPDTTKDKEPPRHICKLQADIQEAFYIIGKHREKELVLKEGESYAPYLRHARLKDAILSRGHLEDAFLDNADLSHAYITHTNLRGASLSDAILTDADLTGTNLTGADLTDADLTGTNLTGTNLTGADLTDANLTGTNLTDANLTDANLTDANLTDANLTDANLTDANLTDVQGLTQKQIDEAVIISGGSHPNLEGALDKDTNEQLIWRGQTISKDDAE